MSKDGNRNPDCPPPAAPPPVGVRRDGSEPYEGIQNEQLWRAGETDSRGIIDATRKPGLYRLTLSGSNVEISLRYGTNATLLLTALRPPIAVTIPGQCGVSAKPISGGDGASISATLVRVTASSTPNLRRKRSTAGAIAPEVAAFFTLEPCSITIDGVNYPVVPAFTRIPLIQPSLLVSGSGFEEFDP